MITVRPARRHFNVIPERSDICSHVDRVMKPGGPGLDGECIAQELGRL